MLDIENKMATVTTAKAVGLQHAEEKYQRYKVSLGPMYHRGSAVTYAVIISYIYSFIFLLYGRGLHEMTRVPVVWFIVVSGGSHGSTGIAGKCSERECN